MRTVASNQPAHRFVARGPAVQGSSNSPRVAAIFWWNEGTLREQKRWCQWWIGKTDDGKGKDADET